MPQRAQQSIRNKFNKGLLTEFSELGFPEDASIDELNCDLKKAGNRTRRLGLEYESGYSLSDGTYDAARTAQAVGFWRNVGKNADIDFVVVQMGSNLLFYEQSATLSANPVPVSDLDSSVYSLDLSAFAVSGSSIDLSRQVCDVTSLRGVLVVVCKGMEAFYIERSDSDNSFSTTQIDFKERDFEWLSDPVSELYQQSAANPGEERIYDTLNAGWDNSISNTPLTTYQATYPNRYPPLVLPWYSGKDTNGTFSIADWEEFSSGNTLAANGNSILGVFNKDRAANYTQVTSLPVESTTDRFSTCETFAGRIFYGGFGSRIYFTQIIVAEYNFGQLHQVNDPTSENFSDLLDTDGGYIDIPEAVDVKKIHNFGSSLLVFADNGVWRITGVDGVFRATEFSVYKVTDVGIASSSSYVEGENGTPFWWSYSGIYTIQVTDEGGMVEVNISRPTIQTFWDGIDSIGKENVKGAWDPFNSRVFWFYPSNSESNSNKLNEVLVLDTELGAFFPWRIADAGENSPVVLDAFVTEGSFDTETTFNVVDSSINQVIDSNSDTVVEDVIQESASVPRLFCLVMNSAGKITFARFTSTTFLDWGGADYSSYAEGAYDFFGDLAIRKNAPYITVFARSTETGFSPDGSNYIFTRPSSLLVSCYWDFKSIPSVSQQQAYRIRRPYVVDNTNLSYTPEYTVNMNRLKLRGRGRVVRLRFESETGKDFNLLGWELLGARNPSY